MAKAIIVKQWIYTEAQAKAQKYGFTLVWDCIYQADESNSSWNPKDLFCLYGEPVRETEKAVLYELDYWNLNRAGRYVTDAPRCTGFKVWIPKSAILTREQAVAKITA